MAQIFRSRYEQLREAEHGKNTLLEDMLDEIANLNIKLKDIEGRLEREKDTSSMYFERYKEHDGSLKTMQTSLRSHAFVSVPIDGDCMNFLDILIKDAEVGGQQAAQLLRKAASEYVRAQVHNLDYDYELVVHVYSNVRGLMKAYTDANIIHQREDLDRFIRGFNMSHPLFNFIDAGNGKECSDAKLKEVFKLHKGNEQCKHIIFGGSSDNGYARLLMQHSGDEIARQRITMLEGPPFAHELQKLADKFKTTAYRDVFRSTKIEAASTEPSVTQYREIIPPQPTSTNRIPSPPQLTTVPTTKDVKRYKSGSANLPPKEPPTDPSATSWRQPTSFANQVSKTPAPPNGFPSPAPTIRPSPSTATTSNSSPQKVPDGHIAVNIKGERVDSPLKPSSTVVNAIKPRKMCNNYHLRNSCTNPTCSYEHGHPLAGDEKEALKFIARQVPCEDEIYCEDAFCMFGHRCTSGAKCNKFNCRFSDAMHHDDDKIVRTYEGF